MDYAPSSIEVMTTKDAKLSITDLQALLNDLSGRMNEMDQRLKIKLKKEWKNVIVTDKKPKEIIRIIEEKGYKSAMAKCSILFLT